MICLRDVRKVFPSDAGPVTALDSISFEVEAGETLCLIGTSGSGKTTCMKLINRLIEPTSGTVSVAGKDVSAVDPIRLRRGIGYVIQKAGLLPHFSVAENIGLLCKLEGWSASKTLDRVSHLLNLVNMEPEQFLHRYPSELSGGQQQRVGVARALALDPDIILMDEPFGALDPITREGIHEEFLRIKQEVQKTTVIVTHDLAEAFKLGDRIALMDKGRLIQVGREEDFRLRPVDDFVRSFVSSHVSQELPRLCELVSSVESADDVPQLPKDASLKDALSVMLEQGTPMVALTDEDGELLGVVKKESLLECLP